MTPPLHVCILYIYVTTLFAVGVCLLIYFESRENNANCNSRSAETMSDVTAQGGVGRAVRGGGVSSEVTLLWTGFTH